MMPLNETSRLLPKSIPADSDDHDSNDYQNSKTTSHFSMDQAVPLDLEESHSSSTTIGGRGKGCQTRGRRQPWEVALVALLWLLVLVALGTGYSILRWKQHASDWVVSSRLVQIAPSPQPPS